MDRRIPYYTLGFLCSEYKFILRGLPESNSVIVTPVRFDIFLFRFSNQNTKSTWDVLSVLFALCSIRSAPLVFIFPSMAVTHLCFSYNKKMWQLNAGLFLFFPPSCTCLRTGAAKCITKSRRVQSLISHPSPSTFPSSAILPVQHFSGSPSPSHFHCSAPRLVIRDLYLAFSQSFHIQPCDSKSSSDFWFGSWYNAYSETDRGSLFPLMSNPDS